MIGLQTMGALILRRRAPRRWSSARLKWLCSSRATPQYHSMTPPLYSPTRLDRQAYFAEVPPRLLVTERLGDFLQRKGAINEWAYASGLDSAHHLLLVGTAADDQPLQARLLGHQLGRGYLTTTAGENTDQ